MPCTTKTQIQSDILYVADNITAASIMLEDDPDDSNLMGLDEEENLLFIADDISDVLELVLFKPDILVHRSAPPATRQIPTGVLQYKWHPYAH
ncbi:hypothetical protein B0H19DRAFT_1262301 [Mycena capillaripes]|nr:hypothetical protein B0H19DRAFT_1262301 [Mycena capillaripes]